MDFAELFKQLSQNTDWMTLLAVAICINGVTEGIKTVLNARTWLGKPNPFADMDTNRLMPIFAIAIGGAYGFFTDAGPWVIRAFRGGFRYGAVSIVFYNLYKSWRGKAVSE